MLRVALERGQYRSGYQSPFVPAKAGSQSEDLKSQRSSSAGRDAQAIRLIGAAPRILDDQESWLAGSVATISMAEIRKIVRVFIASPGDLAEERLAAKAVVEEFNEIWADQFGYQVELVGWEDAVSMYGRPQGVINKDLEKCEFFIGLLWKRWGTPPDLTGNYTSGFEEEFEISKARREKNGTPEISLYFKDVEQELLLDPGEDLKRVVAFKEKTIAERKIYFERFKLVENFESKFRRCISGYVRKLASSQAKATDEEAKAGTREITSVDQPKPPEEILLPVEAQKFLSGLLSKKRSSFTQEEASRLRLIGQISGVSGNDDQTIGVHDANILHLQRDAVDFSPPEVNGLIESALEHFKQENCPLWYWIARHEVLKRSFFSLYASFGPAQVRSGAFEAMALIDEPFSNKPISRQEVFDRIFVDKADAAVKIAALKYLQQCGFTADLAILRQELEKGDVQTRSETIAAIVQISLRDGADSALATLFELQPETISRRTLKEIFSKAEGISSDRLKQGLESRNADLRLEVARILRSRKVLDAELAEKLLSDNDANVRLEAIIALTDQGKKFSDQEARRILVKPKTRGGFGLGSDYDSSGTQALEKFRFDQLKGWAESELDALVQTASAYDEIPYLARADSYFDKHGDELRFNIKDRFKKYFDETLERMAASGWTAEQIEQVKPLGDFIRKQTTRKALDIVCAKSSATDLGLLREMLKAGNIDYSTRDVSFLRAHGEWADIPLIVSSLNRMNYGPGLLFFSGTSHYGEAASAIHQIGKGRLQELLQIEAPAELIARIALLASAKEFRELDDDVIQQLLLSDKDKVRKAVCLKSVIALPKTRLQSLLRVYTEGDKFRYYNVVHWLDFGISLLRDKSLTGAKKIALEMNA